MFSRNTYFSAKYIGTFFLVILLVASCKKNYSVENSPPETYIFLDKIELTGPNRLKTTVTLHWFGEDKDGKIAGFEISVNNGAWEFTERYDSTFIFSIPSTSDTADIDFKVRAIDDEGQKDPTPAHLIVPVKNTEPVASFIDDDLLPDTLPLVITLQLSGNDPDGYETLDSLYIKVNNSPWYPLPKNTSLVSFIAENPTQAGTGNAKIYLNTETAPQTFSISDFNNDGNNVFYVKAKDKGNLFSEIDTSKTFFIRKKQGEWLFIDHWKLANPQRPITMFAPIFQNANRSYDYLDFNAYKPQYFNPTLRILVENHSKLFWFAQGEASRLDVLLSAESILQNHLNADGKLLLMFPLYSGIPSDNAIFGIIPGDSISSVSINGRIPTGDTLITKDNTYPELINGHIGFITNLNPIYLKPGATALYDADTLGNNWQGPKTLAAKNFKNGNTNIIFFNIGIHQLNGNGNLNILFDRIETEFTW